MIKENRKYIERPESVEFSYLEKRINDFRDVFTVTAIKNYGIGAKLQISNFGVGAYFQPGESPFEYSEEFGLRNGVWGNHDTFDAVLIVGVDRSNPRIMQPLVRKYRKDKVIELIPFESWGRIGLAMAVWSGVRVEINLIEVVDFVLGFVGIDILNDDKIKIIE